jgi:hypothetical protein
MKKSTILLLLLAVLAGVLTWYFEINHPRKADISAEILKPAFSFHSADVMSIGVQRQGEDVLVERQGNNWQITQPVNTRADQAVMESLADSVSSAMVERKFPAPPNRLSTYGLAQPAVTLQLKVKNGSQHRVSMGSKDFNGSDVYALLDGAPGVYLFSSSLLTSADKGLQDLRDNAVLGFRSPDVTYFEIKGAQGDFVLSKQKDDWHLEKPQSSYADDSQVLALLSQIETNRIGAVVSETANDLPKYGLNNPMVTFTARDKSGKSYVLLVGKKTGDDYYARDTSREMIFLIHGDLYKKLNVGMAELRDKNLLHVAESDLAKVEIRNANQTLVCVNQGDKWTVQQPAAQARKEAMVWKFLLPLLNGRATEILDHPSPAITASLAKPAIEATLTEKSGQALHVVISEPDGNYVYARSAFVSKTKDGSVNGSAATASVFKMEKQIYDDLNFPAADVVTAAPGNPATR